MILFKLVLLLNEGLIFGLVAVGVYVAFQWLRFPDLTPDGSFVVGAASYAIFVTHSIHPFLAICLAIFFGALAGCLTAALNSFAKIPAVVSGLLVSTALYSINWLILGKPNQYISSDSTLVGDIPGIGGAAYFLLWVTLVCVVTTVFLKFFSSSIWGLKLRAIGENSLLAKDIGSSSILYTFVGLALSNGIVALAGAMFAQRSFSADINMGIGVTVTGLAGMVLGMLIFRENRKIGLILVGIILAAIIYKAVIFICLEIGIPAETFRLLSALFLVVVFFFSKSSAANILKDLRWN